MDQYTAIRLQKIVDNPKIGDCVICGRSIWFNEAMLEDADGSTHVLCKVVKLKDAEIAALRQQLKEYNDQKFN